MSDIFDMEKYAEYVQSLAMDQLLSATLSADLVSMMKQIVTGAETALALNRGDGEHIACKAGCGTCCAVNVAVLFPEVVAIVDYVQTRFAPEQQQRLAHRLAFMADIVGGLSEEERIVLGESCAFLDAADNCSIYPVRPLICRGVTSINAIHCAEALQAAAAGEERPIVMNIFQKTLLDETFIALAQGMTQLGFDDLSEQLTLGVRELLAEPRQVDLFLARRPVWSGDNSGF